MTSSQRRLEKTDLYTLLDRVKTEVKTEMNCVSVGTITAFDETTQTANVSVNYRKLLKGRNSINAQEYSDVVVEYPVLLRCPVVLLNGGGAYLTFPVSVGDRCLLLFCDRDIDNWLEYGAKDIPPGSDRTHDLSDAVALVGVNSVKDAIDSYSTDSVKMFYGRSTLTLDALVASVIDRHGERLVPPGTGPIPTFATAAPSGWLFMYGQTLGAAGSGATESSDDYEDLFNILKSVPPNSGGTFGAGTIVIPDCRGRVPIFKNNLGGSDSGVLSSGYAGGNRNTLGGLLGEESHQLTIPEMPIHHHGFQRHNIASGSGGGEANRAKDIGNYNTASAGGDQPHNNVQPGIIVNAMIKY